MKSRNYPILMLVLIVAAGIAVSVPGSFTSGPNWPDGQRYTFNGILIHDMIRDAGFLNPYKYAANFYAHYPASNLPYGPPWFAAVFAGFFFLFGISFAIARIVVSVHTVLAALVLWWLALKNYKDNYFIAGTTVAIFLFNPFTLRYSREISPELAVAFYSILSIFFFLKYVDGEKKYFGIFTTIAFGLGYLCKPYIIPLGVTFVLYVLCKKKIRIFLKLESILSACILGLLILPPTLLAFKFATNETTFLANPPMSADILFYYPSITIQNFLFVTFFALIGFAYGLKKKDNLLFFCFLWLVCCYCFFTFYLGSHEIKYFYTFVPALVIPCGVGIAQCISFFENKKLVMFSITVLAGWCVFSFFNAPILKITGYEATGSYIADKIKGNAVLFYGRYDGNFMMGIRKKFKHYGPYVLRGDRQLSVRVSYGFAKESVNVFSPDDILDILKKYGVGYIVFENNLVIEKNFPEYQLLKKTLKDRNLFTKVKTFPIETNWNKSAGNELLVYKFNELKSSDISDQLDIAVPTLGKGISVKIKESNN